MAKKIVGLGNPLLDMSAAVDSEFTERFGLEVPSYQFEGERQAGYYDELSNQSGVQYSPGGATLNSVRIAKGLANFTGQAIEAIFVGCIGRDEFGKKLTDLCAEEKVKATVFQHETALTGVCGVSLVDAERALCTRIGAAREYPFEHFQTSEVIDAVSTADFVYSAGFFLDSNTQAQLEAAKICAKKGSIFATGLSATFFVEGFASQAMQVLPYADIVFGNEEEWEKFAEVHSIEGGAEGAVKAVVKWPLAAEKKSSKRMMLLTRGPESTKMATWDGEKFEFIEVSVKKIPENDILDMNAAGDSFVGGFAFALLTGHTPTQCVEWAHFAGRHILGRTGCSFNFYEEKEPTPSL